MMRLNLKTAYNMYSACIKKETKYCNVCKSYIRCELCKRFGKVEGEKLKQSYKKYMYD